MKDKKGLPVEYSRESEGWDWVFPKVRQKNRRWVMFFCDFFQKCSLDVPEVCVKSRLEANPV